MTLSHLNLCDTNLRLARAHSRNDFVEKAIEFYSSYLNLKHRPDFFEEMFTSAAQKKIDQVEITLGDGQLKIAFEMMALSQLVTSESDISGEQLRKKGAGNVRTLCSISTFEHPNNKILKGGYRGYFHSGEREKVQAHRL